MEILPVCTYTGPPAISLTELQPNMPIRLVYTRAGSYHTISMVNPPGRTDGCLVPGALLEQDGRRRGKGSCTYGGRRNSAHGLARKATAACEGVSTRRHITCQCGDPQERGMQTYSKDGDAPDDGGVLGRGDGGVGRAEHSLRAARGRHFDGSYVRRVRISNAILVDGGGLAGAACVVNVVIGSSSLKFGAATRSSREEKKKKLPEAEATADA